MDGEGIDFISAYCDRWCERCRFTERCSLHACEVAIAMCGDEDEGMELAVGTPHPESNEPRKPTVGERLLEELASQEPTAAEVAEFEREEEALRERIENDPLTTLATAHMMLAHRWLQLRGDELTAGAGPLLADAMDVIAHDHFFIPLKINRALRGRDRWSREGPDEGETPVQNDWNGSAKVALLSLERSEAAWRLVADASNDPEAQGMADATATLRAQVAARFPDAMAFVRPGFDTE